MTKRLIVNADNFGYSYSINKGIIEAIEKGIVTSTSVMVNGVAASEADDLQKYDHISIGLHLELAEVKNVELELMRQVKTFNEILGRSPDHIDTHKCHTTDDGIKEVLREYSASTSTPVREFGFAKYIDSYIGFRTNNDASVDKLKQSIDEATDEFNELMCHVGYSDDYLRDKSSYNDIREKELFSICSDEISEYLEQKNIELISWKAIKV